MKKMAVIVLLFVLVFLTVTYGCRNEGVNIPENSAPFIAVQTDENMLSGILNVWNLGTGKIEKTSHVIYKTNNTKKIVAPVFWDGEKLIVLPHSVSEKTNLYKRISLPETYTGPGMHGVISENYIIMKISDSNKIYSVKKLDSKTNSFKEICDISSTPYYYPIGITNDDNYIYILFCGDYNFQSGNVNLGLCTININSKKSEWKKVKIQKGVGLPVGPVPEDVIATNGYFYLPGCCNYFIKINAENGEASKWIPEIPKVFIKNNSKLNFIMLGNFRGTIFIKMTLNESPSFVYDILALNPDKRFVGGIKVSNGSFEVIGKNGNVLSKTVFKNINYSVIFPRTNAGF